MLVNWSLSHQAIIGRRLDEAITYLVTEQLLWIMEALCICACGGVRACVSAFLHHCVGEIICVFVFTSVCVCVCEHMFVCLSRQQMEVLANWVKISGGVWSRLTRGQAAAPGLGLLPPLAPWLAFWLLAIVFLLSLHLLQTTSMENVALSNFFS